jgi:Protein of unknown function (DUF2917)
MNTDLIHAAHQLSKGQMHRLDHGHGLRIEALTGCLWITQDHDQRDIVLEAGEGFTLDRDGDTLLSALSDSSFLVLEPPSQSRRVS